MGTELIVVRTHKEEAIRQRRADGYIDATAMCRANGKRWNDYWRLAATQEFLAELCSVAGIPATELVQVQQGGDPALQGTWVHPDVAINLAQWCSPRFAVWVSQWVRELLTTGHVEIPNFPVAQPVLDRAWSRRISEHYLAHKRLVNRLGTERGDPAAWTCIIATVGEILAMEDSLLYHNIEVHDTDRPDQSIGQCWANYRLGVLKRPTHKWNLTASLFIPLSGGRVKEIGATVYPATERACFEGWLNTVYLPQKSPNYLIEKFRKEYGLLPPASAADRLTSRLLDNQPASLPPRVRQQLTTAGGVVKAPERVPGLRELGPAK